MEPTTSTFTSHSGHRIFVRSWLPSGTAKGAIVIVHGFNSHSGYYQWVADGLTSSQYAVYAPDLEGRGQSEGERFYIKSIYDWVDEVDQVVDIAKAAHRGLPVFVLGHSAGGVTACLYALEYGEKISGLICESFAYQLPAPGFALATLKGLSYLFPHLHTVKLKNEDFSRDVSVVASMNNDSMIAGEAQPLKTMQQLITAGERLKKEFADIKTPLLILHGTKDKATKCSGSQFFYERTGSADKTIKLYDGHYHDLLNDTGKEKVMADIQSWLIRHT